MTAMLEVVKTPSRRLATKLPTGDDEKKAIIFHTNVTRFVFPDFTTHGPWLKDKLHRHWQNVTEKTLIGWLRGCIDLPSFHFVKTDHAVALAQISHKPMCSIPEVEEIFVFTDGTQDSQYEGAALYVEMKRWAFNIGASEMIIESLTDIPHHLIVEALGHTTKKTLTVMEVS